MSPSPIASDSPGTLKAQSHNLGLYREVQGDLHRKMQMGTQHGLLKCGKTDVNPSSCAGGLVRLAPRFFFLKERRGSLAGCGDPFCKRRVRGRQHTSPYALAHTHQFSRVWLKSECLTKQLAAVLSSHDSHAVIVHVAHAATTT